MTSLLGAMFDHCETRKAMKSKKNNISGMLIVCIVINTLNIHISVYGSLSFVVKVWQTVLS